MQTETVACTRKIFEQWYSKHQKKSVEDMIPSHRNSLYWEARLLLYFCMECICTQCRSSDGVYTEQHDINCVGPSDVAYRYHRSTRSIRNTVLSSHSMFYTFMFLALVVDLWLTEASCCLAWGPLLGCLERMIGITVDRIRLLERWRDAVFFSKLRSSKCCKSLH